MERAISAGAELRTVTIVESEAIPIAYTSGRCRFYVKAAGEWSGRSISDTTESDSNPSPTLSMEVDQSSQTSFCESPSRAVASPAYGTEIDITSYTPNVQADQWFLSETDLEWIADGCYILGCGGGGSPLHAFLELREMVRNGSIIRVVDLLSVPQDAMIGWGGGMGSPEVTSERLLGNECVRSSSICVGLCHQ